MSTVTFPGNEFDIGNLHAGAKMRPEAQDGVADVIEMGQPGLVEQEAILQLAGVADNAVVPDDHMLANIGVVADLAVAPDDGGAFDHGAVLDHRPFADKDAFTDVGHPLAPVMQPRTQSSFDVGRQLAQRIPSVLAALKDRRVLALGKIKQIARLNMAAS